MAFLFFIGSLMIIFIFVSLHSLFTAKKKLRKRLINGYGSASKDFDSETWGSVYTYWDQKQYNENINPSIDDITWNDLDMNEIFKQMDHCLTSIGEEYLYASLHEPQSDDSLLNEREKLISFFDSHCDDRLEIQTQLAQLGKSNYNDLATLIFNSHLKALKHPEIFTLLSLFPFIFIPVAIFSLPIALFGFIAAFLLNAFVYYFFKKEIAKNLLTIKYLSATLRCCDSLLKKEVPKALAPFYDQLKKDYAPFKTLGHQLSGIMSGGASDMDYLLEYFRILTLSDFRSYNKGIATVAAHQENFHALFKDLGELDCSIALASFRKSLPYYSTPQFNKGLNVTAKNLYHPLLKDPVANDILFHKNSLITGSNASGKSTFVKALAINNLLAQSIYTCTATEFSLGFSLTVSAMAVRDDIMAGDSYFMAEIKALKRTLALTKNNPCLCFIDEILKGTNTIERIAASATILDYLSHENCLCLIASHDIELTKLSNYDHYHFRETITKEAIFFDYTLYSGPSQTRNAIALLNYLDFDPVIVKNANDLVEDFMTTQSWHFHPSEK